MSFDVSKFYLLWQVGDMTAHHVKDPGIGLEAIAIQIRQPIDEAFVNMSDKTGLGIKQLVAAIV
jgi:hypothetical protein